MGKVTMGPSGSSAPIKETPAPMPMLISNTEYANPDSLPAHGLSKEEIEAMINTHLNELSDSWLQLYKTQKEELEQVQKSHKKDYEVLANMQPDLTPKDYDTEIKEINEELREIQTIRYPTLQLKQIELSEKVKNLEDTIKSKNQRIDGLLQRLELLEHLESLPSEPQSDTRVIELKRPDNKKMLYLVFFLFAVSMTFGIMF